MNIRFYNAKILISEPDHKFRIEEGELWVKGNRICYIGDGEDVTDVCGPDEILIWEREIDVKGNLLMPGFNDGREDIRQLKKWLGKKCISHFG